jgi:hypothetical protein
LLAEEQFDDDDEYEEEKKEVKQSDEIERERFRKEQIES